MKQTYVSYSVCHSIFCTTDLRAWSLHGIVLEWPPRSCSFTLSDFYLWRNFKFKVLLNSFSQNRNSNRNIASHTTYVVCVNCILGWRDLNLKVDSERHIFEKHFSWQFLLSEFLPEIYRRRNILFTFSYELWPCV